MKGNNTSCSLQQHSTKGVPGAVTAHIHNLRPLIPPSLVAVRLCLVLHEWLLRANTRLHFGFGRDNDVQSHWLSEYSQLITDSDSLRDKVPSTATAQAALCNALLAQAPHVERVSAEEHRLRMASPAAAAGASTLPRWAFAALVLAESYASCGMTKKVHDVAVGNPHVHGGTAPTPHTPHTLTPPQARPWLQYAELHATRCLLSAQAVTSAYDMSAVAKRSKALLVVCGKHDSTLEASLLRHLRKQQWQEAAHMLTQNALSVPPRYTRTHTRVPSVS